MIPELITTIAIVVTMNVTPNVTINYSQSNNYTAPITYEYMPAENNINYKNEGIPLIFQKIGR